MAKKKRPAGRTVLVKLHLPVDVHQRLRAHAASGGETLSVAVTNLIEEHVFDYAKLRGNPDDAVIKAMEVSAARLAGITRGKR